MIQLNCESSEFHDLHWLAMSLSKRFSHCKTRCQSSWNNIFALIVNGVTSPLGSKNAQQVLLRFGIISSEHSRWNSEEGTLS